MFDFSYNIAAEQRVTSTIALPNHKRHWRAKMDNTDVTPLGDQPQLAEKEFWKPVPSEPGLLASSLGRVLQAPGHAPLPNGGFRLYTPEPRLGQVAKASKAAKHEYRHIMVRRYGPGRRQAPRKVHQLVCEAFHGPKPFEKAVVMHLDENALNNRPENLKWGTQKENLNAPGHLKYLRTRHLAQSS